MDVGAEASSIGDVISHYDNHKKFVGVGKYSGNIPGKTVMGYYVKDWYKAPLMSLEDKERFLDDLLSSSSPRVYVINRAYGSRSLHDVLLDGMQVLETIRSFCENEYSIGGQFHKNLSTAETAYFNGVPLTRVVFGLWDEKFLRAYHEEKNP